MVGDHQGVMVSLLHGAVAPGFYFQVVFARHRARIRDPQQRVGLGRNEGLGFHRTLCVVDAGIQRGAGQR